MEGDPREDVFHAHWTKVQYSEKSNGSLPTVLLTDDHAMFREGMALALRLEDSCLVIEIAVGLGNADVCVEADIDWKIRGMGVRAQH